MNNKKVSFNTYESFIVRFKEKCDLSGQNMSERMNELLKRYLWGDLGTTEELRANLIGLRKNTEKKTYKVTMQVNDKNYSKLKERLTEGNIRPATVLTYIIAYDLQQAPRESDYSQKAELLLEISPADVRHVVYGVKYYMPPVGGQQHHTKLVKTEFFLDACTEGRWQDWYFTTSPLIEVLAVHR